MLDFACFKRYAKRKLYRALICSNNVNMAVKPLSKVFERDFELSDDAREVVADCLFKW